jgi:sigma-B regulation protein RsbU (phosphoserine phosphatase)
MSGGGPLTEANAAFDAAPCGLLQTAEDGSILRANQVFCAWVGTDAAALIGVRRFQDLLSMGARIFHQTHWAPLLRMQGSISEIKLDICRHDGSTLPVVFNAVRRIQGSVTVHEIAAFVASDRDAYERELLRSRGRLEELVAELTRLKSDAQNRATAAEQMIGIVSHDLRNPLSSIRLATAVLNGSSPSDNQKRTLDRLARATERADHLISDLLDFTQARLGKGLSVVLAPVDLHAIIGHAVDELGPLYSRRALCHLRSGTGVCLGDGNRLLQLVGNLISNAMTYGDASAPVTVTSSVAPSSFTIAVHNAGPAIPSELQARIFQPMTRGTDTNAGRSVGLGLFIVQEIARAHGGSVTLTSTAEEGTTFVATMQRREGSSPAEA